MDGSWPSNPPEQYGTKFFQVLLEFFPVEPFARFHFLEPRERWDCRSSTSKPSLCFLERRCGAEEEFNPSPDLLLLRDNV